MKIVKMSISILAFLASMFLLSCSAPNNEKQAVELTHSNMLFDSLWAKKADADPYGMKKYVFAFLKKGPNRETDSVKAATLQKAHLKNIKRMADEGKLVLAGPFFDDDTIRGIYIFNVQTIEEAEALVGTDPLIASGGLVMELREWYGSAALIAVNDIHKMIAEKKIVE